MTLPFKPIDSGLLSLNNTNFSCLDLNKFSGEEAIEPDSTYQLYYDGPHTEASDYQSHYLSPESNAASLCPNRISSTLPILTGFLSMQACARKDEEEDEYYGSYDSSINVNLHGMSDEEYLTIEPFIEDSFDFLFDRFASDIMYQIYDLNIYLYETKNDIKNIYGDNRRGKYDPETGTIYLFLTREEYEGLTSSSERVKKDYEYLYNYYLFHEFSHHLHWYVFQLGLYTFESDSWNYINGCSENLFETFSVIDGHTFEECWERNSDDPGDFWLNQKDLNYGMTSYAEDVAQIGAAPLLAMWSAENCYVPGNINGEDLDYWYLHSEIAKEKYDTMLLFMSNVFAINEEWGEYMWDNYNGNYVLPQGSSNLPDWCD